MINEFRASFRQVSVADGVENPAIALDKNSIRKIEHFDGVAYKIHTDDGDVIRVPEKLATHWLVKQFGYGTADEEQSNIVFDEE